MMKRIRAGDIGDVLHIEAQQSGATGHRLKPDSWRANRAEAPGGGMTARGIHTLDSMIQIGGLVSSVYAFSDHRKLPQNLDMDDTTSMLLRFANGVTGYLGTVLLTGELWRVHVFGTRGWLEMRGDSDLTYCAIDAEVQRIQLPKIDKERATLEAFADAVAAKKTFVVPADEAVNGIAVLEQIEVSARSGQPVKIA